MSSPSALRARVSAEIEKGSDVSDLLRDLPSDVRDTVEAAQELLVLRLVRFVDLDHACYTQQRHRTSGQRGALQCAACLLAAVLYTSSDKIHAISDTSLLDHHLLR